MIIEGKLWELARKFATVHKMPVPWTNALMHLVSGFYQMPVGRRFYHTLSGHVFGMLDRLQDMQLIISAEEEFMLVYSILMHDIYYVPGDPYNEMNSAKLACALLRATPKEHVMTRVNHIILETDIVTGFKREPLDRLCQLMCDLDIANMSEDYETFIRNGELIRKEFRHVNDKDFERSRKQFLMHLLDRGYIYLTKDFRLNHEEKAIANIKRFLEE